MNFQRLFVIIVLMALSCNVSARDWVKIGKRGGSTLYYDRESVQVSDSFIYLFVLRNEDFPIPPAQHVETTWSSISMRTTFDCKKRLVSNKEAFFYTGIFLRGERVWRLTQEEFLPIEGFFSDIFNSVKYLCRK